jgi:hypothetical protein
MGWALFGVLSIAAITTGLALAVNSQSGGQGGGALPTGGAPAPGGEEHPSVVKTGTGDAAVAPAAGAPAPDAATVAAAVLPPDAAVAAIATNAQPEAPTQPGSQQRAPLTVPSGRRPVEREPRAVAIRAAQPDTPDLPTGHSEDPPARDTTEVVGHGADTEVVITTRPRGASLYVHGLTIGSDGVTFRRPRGTRMEVRCLFPGNDGWEPGSVMVSFDGQRPQLTCQMEAKTRCVKDIKNPFKNCPM